MQRSSGNVFTDLGFPTEEATHLLIRADLMIQLKALIEERGLTQKRAAQMLGVSQPRISDLVRGRIDLFSIDTLVEMLTHLGVDVTVKTRLVRIGNSRGLRLPKPLIEQLGFEDEVEMRTEGGALVIRPARSARAGWADAAAHLVAVGEGALDTGVGTRFDADAWE
jgi:predicted XRE-type DNA-binding protein/antitoxin component of MazEF toxin-antitoxin module